MILLGLLSACSEQPEKTKDFDVAALPEPTEAVDLYSPEVDSVLGLMSVEQKIGELIWLDVNLEKKVKKSITLPYLGRLSFGVQNDSKIIVDQNGLITYFAKDFYLPFEDPTNTESFVPADLNSITDTAFWSEYHKTTSSYFLHKNVSSLLIDNSTKSQDSTFQLELDFISKHGILLGGDLDSNYSLSKSWIERCDIALVVNADSVIDVPDTVCRYYLKTVDWSDTIADQFIQYTLLGDHDGFKFTVDSEEQLLEIVLWMSSGYWTKYVNHELLDYKVRKSIALKLWNKAQEAPLNDYLTHINLIGLSYQSKYKSITLINNKQNLLPLSDLPKKKWSFIALGDQNKKSFIQGMDHYTSISAISQKFNALNLSAAATDPVIVLIDDQEIDSISLKNFVKQINSSSKKCIVVNIGHPEYLSHLNSLPTIVQVWNVGDYGDHLAQLIVGGCGFSGGVPRDQNCKFIKTNKTRLSYTIPEEVGFSSDSLKKIDKIAAEAVWGGATPGCQVFAAKDGKVIINKGFGYRTYLQKHKVTTETTYDIASVTKVAATTICGMHMYDRGLYKLNDSLKLHLPDSLNKCLGHFSRLYNVTFQRLFTHTSGLPAGLPIYKYMMYTDSSTGRWDKYYCDEPNKWFKVEVAKNFYMDSAYLDTLWLETNNIWTGTKEYKYSDANMNVLYQIFRSKLKPKQRYEKYLDSVFYKPLGMDGTCFLPKKNLDTLKHPLTPTENETYWRKQLIQGYVHDPNAAIYGGVAGNAGLFSNANDLGILMWMLMNGGSYGGKQYIQSTTVKKFSVHQEGSHRGLGFDKPTASSGNVVAPDCPYTAYGHTGFTGICVWNDPENDLVFVFTSNRVHPNANNKKLITFGVRKRLHQVFYDQLYYNGSYKNEATDDQPVTRSNKGQEASKNV